MNWYQRVQAKVGSWWEARTRRVVVNAKTASGEWMTPEKALRQATVWACVRYLSQTVAQLPWRVCVASGGKKKVITNSAVARLLGLRPNSECGPFALKESLVAWACTHGNAVAEIEWNNRGEPLALWPIHPDNGCFERDRETGELLYRVWYDHGGWVYLRPEDYFHIRGFGDGAVGLSVMDYAAETIGLARATELFGATYFGQGTAPSGVLNTGKVKLSSAGKEALEKQIQEKFGGSKNAHRTLIVDFDGGGYSKLMSDPAAAQLTESKYQLVEEICRWFGVPPHKAMHLLRATFSNIEHQSIEVVVDTITPWCIRLEEEADYKLFGRNMQGYYSHLDLKGLLRGDFKSRQEGLQIMRRNGIINANDWLAFEDMDPIGDQGDTYIVEGNMTPLNMIEETARARNTVRPAPGSGNSGYDPAPSPAPAARARVNGAH